MKWKIAAAVSIAAPWSVFITWLMSSCFNPDMTGIVYTCTAEKPLCPQGQWCERGLCVIPGLSDAQGPSADMSTAQDMPPADMSPAIVSGCRSGAGSKVGNSWACVGEFKSSGFGTPTAEQLCADGWKVCPDASKTDLGACSLVPGYFAANAVVSSTGCMASPVMFPSFSGCGSDTRSGFTRTVSCWGFNSAWLSNDSLFSCYQINGSYSLEGCVSKRVSNGVLCCKV